LTAYGTNVGAGDLANIITYRKSGDVSSQTGRAAQGHRLVGR